MNREEFKQKYSEKQYLGDGLYAAFDGYQIILSTEREFGIHWIGLEPDVYEALIAYGNQLFNDGNNIIEDSE